MYIHSYSYTFNVTWSFYSLRYTRVLTCHYIVLFIVFKGASLTLATLSLEIFPAESRGFVVSLGSIAWALSISSLSLVAFLLRHVSWRYTMLASGLIGMHSLATRWYVTYLFMTMSHLGAYSWDSLSAWIACLVTPFFLLSFLWNIFPCN